MLPWAHRNGYLRYVDDLEEDAEDEEVEEVRVLKPVGPRARTMESVLPGPMIYPKPNQEAHNEYHITEEEMEELDAGVEVKSSQVNVKPTHGPQEEVMSFQVNVNLAPDPSQRVRLTLNERFSRLKLNPVTENPDTVTEPPQSESCMVPEKTSKPLPKPITVTEAEAPPAKPFMVTEAEAQQPKRLNVTDKPRPQPFTATKSFDPLPKSEICFQPKPLAGTNTWNPFADPDEIEIIQSKSKASTVKKPFNPFVEPEGVEFKVLRNPDPFVEPAVVGSKVLRNKDPFVEPEVVKVLRNPDPFVEPAVVGSKVLRNPDQFAEPEVVGSKVLRNPDPFVEPEVVGYKVLRNPDPFVEPEVVGFKVLRNRNPDPFQHFSRNPITDPRSAQPSAIDAAKPSNTFPARVARRNILAVPVKTYEGQYDEGSCVGRDRGGRGDQVDPDVKDEEDFSDPTRGPPFVDFSADAVHEFFLINIVSPSDFYMQIGTEASKALIMELEEVMTAFYDKYYYDKEGWLQPTSVWKYGFYAAYIPRLKAWVRCWVEDIMREQQKYGETEVLLQLIDYGQSEIVPRKYILPLRNEYIVLPTQAYIGKLHVLGQLASIWKASAKKAFSDDGEGEHVYALVTGMDEKFPPYRELSVVLFYGLDDENGLEQSQALYNLRGLLTCGYRTRNSRLVRAKNKRHVRFE